MIHDSVTKVETGSDLVNDTGEMLAEIMTSVREVVDIVGQISAASQQQFVGIQEVGGAISDMEEMTRQNAALVIQLAGASRRMSQSATGMHNSLDFFNLSTPQDEQIPEEDPVGARVRASNDDLAGPVKEA